MTSRNFNENTMDTNKVLPTNLPTEAGEAEASRPLSPIGPLTAGDRETSDLPKLNDGNSPPPSQEEADALGGDNTPLSRKDVLVLVVDDIVDNVVILSLDLQQEGYRVVTASNGEEAVRVATLMRPNIILMDIGMPLLDGLGATTKIREDESLRTVPIIAVTAFTTAGFRRAAYDVGFDGYLTKPVDFQQMHELINRLLS